VYQENQGPYSARNKGLDSATAPFVAFLDSDDAWLPHHLGSCVAALRDNPQLDWCISASRRVEHKTGKVLLENDFRDAQGELRPFFKLRSRTSGNVHLVDDPKTLSCVIRGGLNFALQTAVFRANVFTKVRFVPNRVCDDQILAITALNAGFRLGYLNDVHVVYNLHEDNLSMSALNAQLTHKIDVVREEARGFEQLLGQGILPSSGRRAVRQRLLEQFFWTLGYSLLWQHSRRREAFAMFHKGLGYWPWSLSCWKTYSLALIKALCALGKKNSDPQARNEHSPIQRELPPQTAGFMHTGELHK
jgi:glycosyltransferase involved in cell wall biosynthesis